MRVFQIGFNRCGTVSLYQFFKKCGVPSVHWDYGKLAKSMFRNIGTGLPLLQEYPDTVFFSDMESDIVLRGKPHWFYAHIECYKLLDQQYPGSKFILNVRNMEDWLKSRCNFKMSPAGGKSEYVDFAKIIHSKSLEEILDIWRSDWLIHNKDVLNYFKDRSNDLLVYNIDTDTSDKIVDFFKGSLELKNYPFPKSNSGKL